MILFYGGFMSQWYPAAFVIEEQRYNCAEQYMMAQKALLFADEMAYSRIMRSDDPATQKRIGRRVKGFDPVRWYCVSRDVVFRGNIAKFTQNNALRRRLIETSDEELVEASPTDRIWGIGLSEDDPDARDKTKWRGENWLGRVLMEVRSCL